MSDLNTIGEEEIAALERYKEEISSSGTKVRITETVRVYHVPFSDHLDEGDPWRPHHEAESYHFQRQYTVMEMLELIADKPLKDQVCMMSNLLTMSGYTQSEIAEALGMPFKTYRNRLLDMRNEFKREARFL